MAKDFSKKKAVAMSTTMGEKATPEDVAIVEKKMDSMKKGPLKKVWNKVTDIWDLYNSADTPQWAKVTCIGGLIYMVSPLDLIPDILFPIGLLDDVFVIGFVFSQVVVLTKTMKQKKAKGNCARQELLKELNNPLAKEKLLKEAGYGSKKEIKL